MFILGWQLVGVNTVANDPATAPDGRRQPRTHLFVSAVLCCGAGSAPVNIRNMSQSGALIEAAVLPEPGSRIILKRGSLQAAGRIAWHSSRRAGLSFEGMIHVSDWLARTASSGQDRVDEIVAGFKARSPRPEGPATPSNNVFGANTVEAELATIRGDLVALSESLIRDAIIAATHPEIQTFDIALQRIDRILLKLRQAV